MSAADHPRRLDAAEKVARRPVAPDAPLTSMTPASLAVAKAEVVLDQALDAVETDPYQITSDPVAAETAQAAAIQAFLCEFRIEDQTRAEWAVQKIADAERRVEDLLASYEDVKAEWEAKIRAAKRRQEIRAGIFVAALREYGEKALGLPSYQAMALLDEKAKKKLKKTLIVGARKLAYTDTDDSLVLGEEGNAELVARLRAEDPENKAGRLAVVYKVANLNAEKERALAAFKETGEIPGGFDVKPGGRRFTLQQPKGKGD